MRHRMRIVLPVVLVAGILMIPRTAAVEETPVRTKDPGCRMPEDDEISSIVAEMYWNLFSRVFSECRDIQNFQIPREKFAGVLQYFEPNEPDPEILKPGELASGAEIGTIRINFTTGGCIRICWFDYGQNRLRFSYNGPRYIRTGEYIGKAGDDETMNADGRIRKLHDDLVQQQKRKKAKRDLRDSSGIPWIP